MFIPPGLRPGLRPHYLPSVSGSKDKSRLVQPYRLVFNYMRTRIKRKSWLKWQPAFRLVKVVFVVVNRQHRVQNQTVVPVVCVVVKREGGIACKAILSEAVVTRDIVPGLNKYNNCLEDSTSSLR